MDLAEALRSTGTCRYYDERDVDDKVLERIFDAARFAGQGGNRQPVRYIVVRDAGLKTRLRDRYLEPWSAYVQAVQQGRMHIGGERARRAVDDADHMARNLHRVPILVVVCAELAQITATDKALDRVGMVAGASVYPSVQNLILAARLEGLGTALTTLLCQYEPWMREQLSIPVGVAVAAVLALGYPASPPPRRLSRLPVSELVFREQFGERMF